MYIVRKQQVAVADHGHGNGGRDLGDGGPVGGMAIARFACAAVHKHAVGATVHGGLRQFEIVQLVRFPSEADLHRHRHLDRGLHRLHDLAHPRRLAAERRAEAHAGEVIDGAAEIDVDEVRPARFHQRRRPRHLLRLVAGELYGKHRLVGRPSDERKLSAFALFEPTSHHHFADKDAGAQFHAELAVGKVGAFGHRRRNQRAGDKF